MYFTIIILFLFFVVQDALQQLTGGRSVPRVFIGQQFIGGGDDTVALARSGELQKKLQQAGAL